VEEVIKGVGGETPKKKKKKKKKRKKSTVAVGETVEAEQEEPIPETNTEEEPSKKKRKRKSKKAVEVPPIPTTIPKMPTTVTVGNGVGKVANITRNHRKKQQGLRNDGKGVKRKIPGEGGVSEDRLRAYGINPTKYEKRKKYAK